MNKASLWLGTGHWPLTTRSAVLATRHSPLITTMRLLLITLLALTAAQAELRTMTLREAVAVALKQNPDLLVARFDQARARYGVQIARDPFTPKVIGGSGAAWTSGYPVSINGQPPSVFQAQTIMSLYNRPQSFKVAQARENVRGADIELSRQQDDVAYRVASMWLDSQQYAEALEIAHRSVDSLRALHESAEARVTEGRSLPLDAKRAALDLARAEQRSEALSADLDDSEAALAVVLGYNSDDRVRAAREDRVKADVQASEQTAVDHAVANSKEIRVLESRLQAKELELKEYKNARWPVVDLVAQYNLFAQYNYRDYFGGRFQRNNGTVGASITLPLLVGSATRAYLSQTESDIAKIHAQLTQLRGRISIDARKSFTNVRKAETARTVARLDLDVAREQVNVFLAQQSEGRASLKDVEGARIAESDKWIAFYDAEHTLDRVKLNLLRETGTLVTALMSDR